jgi:hypothetical protein
MTPTTTFYRSSEVITIPRAWRATIYRQVARRRLRLAKIEERSSGTIEEGIRVLLAAQSDEQQGS